MHVCVLQNKKNLKFEVFFTLCRKKNCKTNFGKTFHFSRFYVFTKHIFTDRVTCNKVYHEKATVNLSYIDIRVMA